MDVLQKFGIQGVETFTEEMAQQLRTDYQPAVVITGVRRGSIAESQGLRSGVLIASVQGETVETANDLVSEIAKHDATEGIRLRILIWNPANNAFAPRFVLLELPRQ